jgi:hypothetical protein
VQAGGKVVARWEYVAAGGERSKDQKSKDLITPKSSAKKATSGLDMPANRYEALLPQRKFAALPDSAAAKGSEEGAKGTREAGSTSLSGSQSTFQPTWKVSSLEVLVCLVVAWGERYGVRLRRRRGSTTSSCTDIMLLLLLLLWQDLWAAGRKAEDEKKRETETRERTREMRNKTQEATLRMEASEQEISGFEPGSTVTLVSLVSSNLNGRRGIVRNFVPASGRYGVLVDGEKALIGFKPVNLQSAPELGSRVTLVSLVRSDLNGRQGVVDSFDSEKKRFKVKVDGEEKSLALKPNNLREVMSGPSTATSVARNRKEEISKVPKTVALSSGLSAAGTRAEDEEKRKAEHEKKREMERRERMREIENKCKQEEEMETEKKRKELQQLEEQQEKKRKELQQEKDNMAKHTAENILLCLQSGKLLEAKKTLCLAIDNARLNFAVSQRIAQGFIRQKIDNIELNIRKLIIAQGANDSEIIRIIAALIPCIEESYVVEALKYCAQQKAYWRLLEPLLNRLPNLKIRDLPVLKAIENGDSGTLNLLLQAGACPNFDRGPYDVTSLHVAISNGAAFPQGAVLIMEMLLRAKAGMNS